MAQQLKALAAPFPPPERISLCSIPDCPVQDSLWTQVGLELTESPTSPSPVLGLKAWDTSAWRSGYSCRGP